MSTAPDGNPPPNKMEYKFFLLSDVDTQVVIHVEHLLGTLPGLRNRRYTDDVDDFRPHVLYVQAGIFADERLLGLETLTHLVESSLDSENGALASWNEKLEFAVKYRDLPFETQLAVTVYHFTEKEGTPKPLGGATMRMFSKKGRLKTGQQKLTLWEGRKADMSFPTETPGKKPAASRGEIGRLEKLCKRYERGEMKKVEWLDTLTFKELEKAFAEHLAEVTKRGNMIILKLPTFKRDVVFHQAPSHPGPPYPPAFLTPGALCVLHDPVIGLDNPAEMKAQKLARSDNRGVIDKDLKPDTEERRRISAILREPPNRPLTIEQKGLLWRFRFSLTSDRSALTRFLKSVDWGDAQEAKQAAELMQKWAPIDIADALELLSPDFINEEVRGHAVEVLGRADDEELRYYLLQLVQALRFEASDDSKLSQFLISRAIRNSNIGIYFHWYLFTEWEDPTFGRRASKVHEMFVQAMLSEPQGYTTWDGIRQQIEMIAQLAHITRDLKAVRGNATKKAERLREMISDHGPCGEMSHAIMPNPLDPAVCLAGVIPSKCTVFKSALLPLRLTYKTISRREGAGVAGPGPSTSSRPQGPAPSPHVPSSEVHRPASEEAGANPDSQEGDSADKTVLIYKKGDDLRQDQLVVQIVSLMDRLLKKENLDLKLTLYQVLPTSTEDGLVEFIKDSSVLSQVLAKHKTITNFLKLYNPDPEGPFGLQATALETFVKSCAGFCVITYILGVGDRHLDNLMLCTDGRLCHIDFGFIMGRDPKPFPPPMKLCKEMVEAMGGAESEHYLRFRLYSGEAFNILRKSANLILSLFHLMAGADLPDIKADPEKVMLILQEKLRLDLDDEEAVQWIQQLINESASALMPAIMETTHRFAQYWR